MAVPPAEEKERPPPKKAKCKTLKHHLDNKKRGGEALAYLQSIAGRRWLKMVDISRINEIVQSEKKRRFLPKAANELLDTIFLNANENQRAQLLWLV